MHAFQFAQKIISTLSLDPLLPGYSAITFALADKTQGKLGGYVDSNGNLVLGGITTSTLTSLGTAGNFDFSGSSGFFKTPSGTTTIKGPLATAIAGSKASPVAAAGTTISNAAQLAATPTQFLTSSSASAGWALPVGNAGYEITLVILSATAGKLYPNHNSSDTLNGLSAGTNITVAAHTTVTLQADGAGNWFGAGASQPQS
ncbi:MAG TPA: hypothetical protein VGM54_02120 [Chthoniobacter sp.]|jgi:hypothetical protein